MAISNYTELQAAIANWLNRSDLSSRVTEFITLGEARLNRSVKGLLMETTAAVTLTSGNDFAALPSGFLLPLGLWYDTDLCEVENVSIQEINRIQSTSASRPDYYAVSNKIYFERDADATYALTMRYRKKLDIASDATNWLLTNYPDAYLYASLSAAEPFLKNDNRLLTWKALTDQAISEINTLDASIRSAAPLRADDALLGIGRYDILTDR